MDVISRQDAIDALKNERSDWNCDYNVPVDHCIDAIYSVPSAQLEPSIPISWIEKHIDWLKSMDNGFSNITAMNISVLVKKWRKENGKDEQSD